jgi:hypothetical protein
MGTIGAKMVLINKAIGRMKADLPAKKVEALRAAYR